MSNINYDNDERFSYGYNIGGGWDLETTGRAQTTSDGGHIPGRYQWEETVDVEDDD